MNNLRLSVQVQTISERVLCMWEKEVQGLHLVFSQIGQKAFVPEKILEND